MAMLINPKYGILASWVGTSVIEPGVGNHRVLMNLARYGILVRSISILCHRFESLFPSPWWYHSSLMQLLASDSVSVQLSGISPVVADVVKKIERAFVLFVFARLKYDAPDTGR